MKLCAWRAWRPGTWALALEDGLGFCPWFGAITYLIGEGLESAVDGRFKRLGASQWTVRSWGSSRHISYPNPNPTNITT